MYAGARRVVASLWQIDDHATAQLMTRFYRHMLTGGERPAAALRAAQRELAGRSALLGAVLLGRVRHPGRLAVGAGTGPRTQLRFVTSTSNSRLPTPKKTLLSRLAGVFFWKLGVGGRELTHSVSLASGAPGIGRYSVLAMAVPWELTASALDRLLARLDSDPTRAADAYEALRLSLTRFFDWRGAHFPDECADETMNRLARRLDEGAAVTDIRSFALGIARLVLLEQARSPQVRQDELDERRIGQAPAVDRDPEPRLHDCLETCLACCRRMRARSSSSTTRTSGGRRSTAASAWPPSSGSPPTRCAAARSA